MQRQVNPTVSIGSINPRIVLYTSAGIAVSLNVVSVLTRLGAKALDRSSIAMFDVGDEVSFGTWFESTLLRPAALRLESPALGVEWCPMA